MRKFVNIKELNSENLLNVARKCEYQVCVEEFDIGTGLQDAGCLEALLKDGGVLFLEADDKYYYYELDSKKFKVPYKQINEDEDGYFDTYLLFDLKEEI